MKFESKFNIGDKFFVPLDGVPTLVTVGSITIEHIDSRGIDGEELFDNYKPHKRHKETYMCDETGVGSGSVWELGRNVFSTEAECRIAIEKNL